MLEAGFSLHLPYLLEHAIPYPGRLELLLGLHLEMPENLQSQLLQQS